MIYLLKISEEFSMSITTKNGERKLFKKLMYNKYQWEKDISNNDSVQCKTHIIH